MIQLTGRIKLIFCKKEDANLIKYICDNCNGLICETSVCPVCGNRTEIFKSKIYWCEECNAPSFDPICNLCGSKCEYIGTDLRPVFPEERLLIEICMNVPMKYKDCSVWKTSNYYIINGKKIKIKFKELIENNDVDNIIIKLKEYKDINEKYCQNYLISDYIEKFISINKARLNIISDEAFDFIRDVSNNHDLSDMFVSFSGGKDSTVVSNLVTRALTNPRVIHIYGDTTLEYPTTEDYITRFRKSNPLTPMLTAKNKDQDFNDLCSIIGPPSRVMRWCCTIFKTGSITNKIESTFKNKKSLLTFYGIRRNESTARKKYDRDSQSPKITKQRVVSPIIDWTEFDIWLYIFSNNIDFNFAYRQGFSRVGCWCCPNNSFWSEFLSSIYMNDEYVNFRNILYEFAKKVGKPDWKEYIETGKWKARQGGNGLDMSSNAVVDFKPCALEENSLNFTLTKPISNDLYTFFQPFGELNFDIGNKRLNEVFVINKKSGIPILKLSGRLGTNFFKVALINRDNKNILSNKFESLVKCQITKYQTCIGCSACQSICKFDAIKVINKKPGSVSINSISYHIDSNKCTHCLACVDHFDGGCYMKKVLRTKKESE